MSSWYAGRLRWVRGDDRGGQVVCLCRIVNTWNTGGVCVRLVSKVLWEVVTFKGGGAQVLLCVKRWPNVGKSGLHVMTHGSADLLDRPAASLCPRLSLARPHAPCPGYSKTFSTMSTHSHWRLGCRALNTRKAEHSLACDASTLPGAVVIHEPSFVFPRSQPLDCPS